MRRQVVTSLITAFSHCFRSDRPSSWFPWLTLIIITMEKNTASSSTASRTRCLCPDIPPPVPSYKTDHRSARHRVRYVTVVSTFHVWSWISRHVLRITVDKRGFKMADMSPVYPTKQTRSEMANKGGGAYEIRSLPPGGDPDPVGDVHHFLFTGLKIFFSSKREFQVLTDTNFCCWFQTFP